MKTILNTLARLLRAIARGYAQTPYMGLCGPIPWPRESNHEPSTGDPR
jgi:hypothetical protein